MTNLFLAISIVLTAQTCSEADFDDHKGFGGPADVVYMANDAGANECCECGNEGDWVEPGLEFEPKYQTWYAWDEDRGLCWAGMEDINNQRQVYLASSSTCESARRKAVHKLSRLIDLFAIEASAAY